MKSLTSSFLVVFSTLILRLVLVSLLSTRYFSPRQLPSSCWNSGACMTADSCSDSTRSISAMRASMAVIASFDTVIAPSLTWATSSAMRSRARLRSLSERAILLWVRIWSSSPPSTASAVAAPAAWVSVLAMMFARLVWSSWSSVQALPVVRRITLRTWARLPCSAGRSCRCSAEPRSAGPRTCRCRRPCCAGRPASAALPAACASDRSG